MASEGDWACQRCFGGGCGAVNVLGSEHENSKTRVD